MQLIFLVNMNGLFLRKKDEELLLLMHLKKKNQKLAKQSPKDANQMKYGLIKGVNFTIIFTKDF